MKILDSPDNREGSWNMKQAWAGVEFRTLTIDIHFIKTRS